MFPYKRIPKLIASTLPENYVISRSDSGWMVSPAFFEYIANSLYNNLVQRQVKFPVLLFLDRHKSHPNLELSEYCIKKDIYTFFVHHLMPLTFFNHAMYQYSSH